MEGDFLAHANVCVLPGFVAIKKVKGMVELLTIEMRHRTMSFLRTSRFSRGASKIPAMLNHAIFALN